MSQIFRRSNLPSWLVGDAAPAHAAHDPGVRAWMKEVGSARKEAAPVARILEKALARKPETLDLSSAPQRLLEQLPVRVLLRLRGPTQSLVLPQECAPAVALRLMHEVGAGELLPTSLMKAVEQAMSPKPVAKLLQPRLERPSSPATPDRTSAASTDHHMPARRDEAVYDTPPRRDDAVYDTPPRRHEAIDDVPPRRREAIYDVPPRRRDAARDQPPASTAGGYETPAPLFVGRRDAAHRTGVASGRPDETGSDYVLPDRLPAPDGPKKPVYLNQPAPARTALRQRALIDGMPMLPSVRVSAEDIDTALRALRTLTAWSRAHAGNEGQHPRCAMSAGDAEALARVLRQVSAAQLKAHERSSWMAATAALATRPPRAGLHVTPETVGHLERALDAVRMLVADVGGEAPALPGRSRGHGA